VYKFVSATNLKTVHRDRMVVRTQEEFNRALERGDLATIKLLHNRPKGGSWYDRTIGFHKDVSQMVKLCGDKDYADILEFFLQKKQEWDKSGQVTFRDVWTVDMEKCPKVKKLLLEDKRLWKSLPEWKMFSESMEDNSTSLRAEVAQLRKMVELMWYSPGMPGCVMAKEDFEKFITPYNE
jgi:hypothetical protein